MTDMPIVLVKSNDCVISIVISSHISHSVNERRVIGHPVSSCDGLRGINYCPS
jgi:hypothetical protein